jgi:hypothetical protein
MRDATSGEPSAAFFIEVPARDAAGVEPGEPGSRAGERAPIPAVRARPATRLRARGGRRAGRSPRRRGRQEPAPGRSPAGFDSDAPIIKSDVSTWS